MSIEMMGNYLSPYIQGNQSGAAQARTSEGVEKTAASQQKQQSKATGKNSLDMNDFLRLMAAQLQNQDMNNPISESEMMAQMAQMATVTAMTNMTDVAVTTYSASLVGKEVTLANLDGSDGISQLVGKVTGAGLYGGQQIIFVGGKSYNLSQIMAIGTLPDADEKAVWVDERGNVIQKGQGTDKPAEDENVEDKPVEDKDPVEGNPEAGESQPDESGSGVENP